jgi:hypothetical protein
MRTDPLAETFCTHVLLPAKVELCGKGVIRRYREKRELAAIGVAARPHPINVIVITAAQREALVSTMSTAMQTG